MTKKLIVLLLTFFALVTVVPGFSQIKADTTIPGFSQMEADTTIPARKQIAIFTPLFLDSAFDEAGNYRYDNKTFPRQSSAGLEFWEGAQLAIDSLNSEGIPLDIHVYDTKEEPQKIDSVLRSEEFKKINLIIGHVNVNEAAKLARVADSMNVPFINANLPNDAGVTNNPNYVILNPTLPTHLTAIYRFLQRYYSLTEILFFGKKGPMENRLKNYFIEFEKNTAVKLKIKYITLDDNFTRDQLALYLDEDKPNICVSGSLDQFFAHTLCQHLASLSTAGKPNLVIGMPTWDVIDFEKSQFKNLEVVYSTPFYIAPTGKLAASVYEDFKSTFFSRPSDMVFRGFETLYHFAHLLHLYGENIGSSLSDKKYMLFGEYDIQPVINPTTNTLDYFENKKLYFVRKADGVVKTVY